MQGIRIHSFGTPEVMQYEALEDPSPGSGEVLVKLGAIGVNPVDTYIRAGLYPVKPKLPYTPGFDGAGIVEAIGEGTQKYKVGDRVYMGGSLRGTYAERTLCLESQLYPLPSQVTFPEGASVGIPYATAYRALFQKGCARPGETILVHGASGGVGIASVQLARARGLQVIGTAGTEKGRELVAEQGAHHVLDHTTSGYLEMIMTLTHSRGVDMVLEMLANENLGKDLEVLAKGGRVIVIGSRGTVAIDPRETMGRDASIHGMSLMNATAQEKSSIHAALIAGLEDGTLQPVIGKELPLQEAVQAHHDVMESRAYGKIILIPS